MSFPRAGNSSAGYGEARDDIQKPVGGHRLRDARREPKSERADSFTPPKRCERLSRETACLEHLQVVCDDVVAAFVPWCLARVPSGNAPFSERSSAMAPAEPAARARRDAVWKGMERLGLVACIACIGSERTPRGYTPRFSRAEWKADTICISMRVERKLEHRAPSSRQSYCFT